MKFLAASKDNLPNVIIFRLKTTLPNCVNSRLSIVLSECAEI